MSRSYKRRKHLLDKKLLIRIKDYSIVIDTVQINTRQHSNPDGKSSNILLILLIPFLEYGEKIVISGPDAAGLIISG